MKVLGSLWSHTPNDMVSFMKSLSTLDSVGRFNGSIETVRNFLYE